MVLWVILAGAVLVAAYLFGSIPTGYLAGRILKGIDIREHGSRSTGATNVLRTLGKGPALVVLLIDVLKGALAIALARFVYSLPMVLEAVPTGGNLPAWMPWLLTLAGLMALLGHSKSVWINFTGGKSVAAGLGVFLALTLTVGLGTLAVFAVALVASRIVSLSSICAAVAGIVLMAALQQPLPYQLLAIAGGSYVIWRHQANIQRILAGTEPRIGQKESGSTEQSL